MRLFNKLIPFILFLSLSNRVEAQGSGTPSTLRIKIDANGYLVLSAAAQTNPVTTSVFGNARLKTDASGNLLVVLTGGGGAPSDGPFITYTSSSSLSAEQNLGALTTGLLLNTVAVGSATLSKYNGSTCTNQVVTALNASGVATCTTVTSAYVDSSIATGPTSGSTGQTTVTQGDLLYGSAANTWAKLAKDTNTTRYLSNTGTSNNPAWAQVALSTGISGFGTGIATALAVNTGSAGAPVLFNGALGTPSSGTLTSATGLPISTGVTGLGANVATALGTAVGSAGGPLVNGGVLGTPSSGTATNITGLPAGGLTLTDTTTNNVSTSNHGFAPKLDNDATHFLNGQGGYTAPSSSLTGTVTSAQFDKTNGTLAAITGLSTTTTSGKTYIFEAVLPITADAVGGYRVGIGGTTTATYVIISCVGIANAAAISSATITVLGNTCNTGGTATSWQVTIYGSIVVNAGGTLTPLFSQSSANGTSSVLQGAYFKTIQVN